MSDSVNRSLLLVDDDEVFRERLARACLRRGFVVRTASGVQIAKSLIAESPFDCAVVDLRMADGTGIEVVRCLHEMSPAAQIVVLTGYGTIPSAVEAIQAGAINYLMKPVDVEQILSAFQEGPRAASVQLPAPSVPSLDRVEWEHLHRVLQDCDGNITHAAKRLGLHRRSLQRKLAKIPRDNLSQ